MSRSLMRDTVLYIGGAARSGTTVLGRVLSGLDGVVWAGELVWLPRDLLEDRMCTCGLPASECSFWLGVRSHLGWDDAALRRHQKTIWRGRHAGWLLGSAGADGVYRAVATVAGAHTVVDTSKYASRARWAAQEYDAKLLWLTQAPNALISRLTRPRPKGRTFGFLTAVAYARWVEACWAGLSRHRPVTRISAEDVFSNPLPVVERLMEDVAATGWTPERPLPAVHALTGHPRAMHDADWCVSEPPPLPAWRRRLVAWLLRRDGGRP